MTGCKAGCGCPERAVTGNTRITPASAASRARPGCIRTRSRRSGHRIENRREFRFQRSRRRGACDGRAGPAAADDARSAVTQNAGDDRAGAVSFALSSRAAACHPAYSRSRTLNTCDASQSSACRGMLRDRPDRPFRNRFPTAGPDSRPGCALRAPRFRRKRCLRTTRRPIRSRPARPRAARSR